MAVELRTLRDVGDELMRPGAGIALSLLAGSLLAALALVWVIRGRRRPVHSVWFGDHVYDGVLFPVFALAFAVGAHFALRTLIPTAVFRVAIPVLVSLLVIRLTVRVLRRSFPQVSWVGSVEQWVSWAAWIGVVLWLTGVLPAFLEVADTMRWRVGGAQVTLRSLIEGVFTAALVLVIALWISAVLERRLLSQATGSTLSLRKIVATLLRSVLLFVGVLVALSAVGIDLTALSVLGGAVGVGIGLGLQRIAANYVSGFVILAERSVRIGDMVKIDGFEGRITDIRTRYTLVRSLGGVEAIFPNETLITTRVENSTLADPRASVTTTVQVAYGTDVRQLQRDLVPVVAAVPRVLPDPAPAVLLAGFGADGIDLTVAFWIGDPEKGLGGVKSEVNLAVLDHLNARGIEIPYPQRIVHVAAPDGGVVPAVTVAPEATPVTASATEGASTLAPQRPLSGDRR